MTLIYEQLVQQPYISKGDQTAIAIALQTSFDYNNPPGHRSEILNTGYTKLFQVKLLVRPFYPDESDSDGFTNTIVPYTVIATDCSIEMNAAQVKKVAEDLSSWRDPFGQASGLALELIRKIGKPFRIVVIIGSDKDFPKDQNGFQHGVYATIVARSVRLGTPEVQSKFPGVNDIQTVKIEDIPPVLVIIIGSRIWNGPLSTRLTCRLYNNIVAHELMHLLTLIILNGGWYTKR